MDLIEYSGSRNKKKFILFSEEMFYETLNQLVPKLFVKVEIDGSNISIYVPEVLVERVENSFKNNNVFLLEGRDRARPVSVYVIGI